MRIEINSHMLLQIGDTQYAKMINQEQMYDCIMEVC